MAEAQSIVEYRDIPGFPGYRVGSDGSIWSRFDRKLKSGAGPSIWFQSDKWRKLKTYSHKKRKYLQVTLGRNGEKKLVNVHQIVAKVFHGDAPTGYECRHLDGNRMNNTPANLAWGTKKENAADRKLHGTETSGERNGFSKLKLAQVIEIREMVTSGIVQRRIAERFGISFSLVSQIKRKIVWKEIE